MSLEFWKTVFEYGGIILLFLTFLFGAGAVITTRVLNDRQAEALKQFDSKLTEAHTDLEKQKERAALADAKVAGLEKAASDAKADQQKVQTELSHAQEDAANARKAAEEEKIERLKLEAPVAPRRLSIGH